MNQAKSEWTYEQCINILEEVLETFDPAGVNLTDARKMIQVRFKDYLNSILNDPEYEP